MGRERRNRYYQDIHQQAHRKLTGMCAFGQSKHRAKMDGTAKDKIYAYKTYQTYWQHIKYYLRWLQQAHPECRTLKKSRRYIREWLEFRESQGLSSWTIHTELAALTKLYGLEPGDLGDYTPPKRRRRDITRSRGDAVRDRHFSERNHDALIKFVMATGTRRAVLTRLRGKDLWSRDRMEMTLLALKEKDLTDEERVLQKNLEDALRMFEDQQFYVAHIRDKGGKNRFAPVVGPYAQMAIERMQQTAPDELVFQHIPGGADIHNFRAIYATTLYKSICRKIDEIPYDKYNRGTGRMYQSEVYCCRKDERGKKLDKAAMRKVSFSLGHNRLNVVADHYLRDI